jgi:hypothetical protein
MLSFKATETTFIRTKTQNTFQGFGLCTCNLLTKISNYDLSAILPSCLVFELQEPPLLELELRTIFQSFDLFKIYS